MEEGRSREVHMIRVEKEKTPGSKKIVFLKGFSKTWCVFMGGRRHTSKLQDSQMSMAITDHNLYI